jgi:pyruvate formate lyase activating enzyme
MSGKMTRLGLVFSIERFATRDGPGIRTVVFLKGCPLKCLWCDNPESQKPFPELLFDKRKCIKCFHRCINACPKNAITITEHGELQINRVICDACGKCADACPTGALEICGTYMSVEKVFEETYKDFPFYSESGGGVTISGGEPTMQPEFLIELLKKYKQASIHTVLDTCGYQKWDILRSIIKNVNLIFYDVKIIDRKSHIEFTGASNDLILSNLIKIDKEGIPTIVRTPVVPNYTGTASNIRAIGEFVSKLRNIKKVILLPYHRLGESKYEMLGRKYELNATPPTNEYMHELKLILEAYGLSVEFSS